MKNVLLRHSAPQVLITDRGKYFMAEYTEKVLSSLEITHNPTTSYDPQSNGWREKLNHVLADIMSMYVDSDHNN